MNWSYFGIEIAVVESGYFSATVDGHTQLKQTLSEIKEWIDKEIAVNVKKITINLPVCGIARHKDDAYAATPRLQVLRTVITGVNRQTGSMQCNDTPAGFEWSILVPDSDENLVLCEQYAAAQKSFNFFQRTIMTIKIDGPGGRINAPSYQNVLDTLTRKYQEKIADCPKVHQAVAKWREQHVS